MTYIDSKAFDTFDHLYRINLINSCSGYKSANLIGTKSNDGVENGTEVCSNNITILGDQNTAPTVSSVILNATDHPSNLTTANLTSYTTYNDVDGDNVNLSHQWLRNRRSYP